jgi:2,5-furandicarboxylate decarboxylase 1
VNQDLRSALAAYEAAGVLARVTEPIDPEFEAAAVLWRLSRGPAVLFENVTGYQTSLVGNVLNTREKLATALGIPVASLQGRFVAALANRIKPELDGNPPCQEVTVDGLDLLDLFPVPAISEHDAGRYISAGLVHVRHPVNGRQNLAICRLQVQGPGRLGIYMAPTHSSQFLQGYRKLGQPMEIAIAIGSHPAMMAASQLLVPHDEIEIAGGIFGEPARVAQCRTVDLKVPAGSEIILEGTIDPGELAPEGPFGEFPGTYAPTRDNPVVRLSAITTRRSPIFQMIVGGTHPEHLITGAIAREVTLFEAVRNVVPGVRQVVLTEGGTCRFHAVIAIDQNFAGESRLAILTAFAVQDLIKHVVVVDGDIDPLDHRQVEWAIATRFRAQDDLVLVDKMKSNPVDPMSVDRTICKIGIDATMPTAVRASMPPAPDVPADVRRRIDARWQEILPGQAEVAS